WPFISNGAVRNETISSSSKTVRKSILLVSDRDTSAWTPLFARFENFSTWSAQRSVLAAIRFILVLLRCDSSAYARSLLRYFLAPRSWLLSLCLVGGKIRSVTYSKIRRQDAITWANSSFVSAASNVFMAAYSLSPNSGALSARRVTTSSAMKANRFPERRFQI